MIAVGAARPGCDESDVVADLLLRHSVARPARREFARMGVRPFGLGEPGSDSRLWETPEDTVEDPG